MNCVFWMMKNQINCNKQKIIGKFIVMKFRSNQGIENQTKCIFLFITNEMKGNKNLNVYIKYKKNQQITNLFLLLSGCKNMNHKNIFLSTKWIFIGVN